MTRHKHLKQLVRSRMAKTGESYSSARRQVLAQSSTTTTDTAGPHFPGIDPGTTALRVVLTAAGIRSPHDGRPFSESMLSGIAGGIGIGVFAFLYKKADFASFFIGGRHLWHDHTSYVTRTAERLGAEVEVAETSSARKAEQDLRRMLDQHGVCIAWVDAARLPHRALPETMGGMAYHLITVYGIDDVTGTARIGDLTDEPVTIALSDLAAARARIRKDNHRVLAVRRTRDTPPLADLVRDGLRACHAGLRGEGAPVQAKRNFTLDALSTWADRLRNPGARESWANVFTPGPRLWNGLTSIHEYIEYYGTGGGLCRPLFSGFLTAAAALTKQNTFADIAAEYEVLGAQWSQLAAAALPDAVSAFGAARELMARRAELTATGGDDAMAGLRDVQSSLAALATRAAAEFPLPAAAVPAFLTSLADRVSAIHAAEVRAHALMGEAVAAS